MGDLAFGWHWMPRAAVAIAPGLRQQSPQNGNIRERDRRLSAVGAPRLGNWEPGEVINARKAAISGPISRYPGCVTNCRNAWLGREDSNLRMVESKSGYSVNDFNEFSDETVDSVP
jgi:hypothetical protein